MSYFEGEKNEHDWSIGFLDLYKLKEVVHKNMPCFVPQNMSLTGQIHLENDLVPTR